MVKHHTSTQIIWLNALISGKIYIVGKKFRRPPVAFKFKFVPPITNEAPYTSGRRSNGRIKDSMIRSSLFSLLLRYFIPCVLNCTASSPKCQRTMTPVMILRPGVPTTRSIIPKKRKATSSVEVTAEYVDFFFFANQWMQSLWEKTYPGMKKL